MAGSRIRVYYSLKIIKDNEMQSGNNRIKKILIPFAYENVNIFYEKIIYFFSLQTSSHIIIICFFITNSFNLVFFLNCSTILLRILFFLLLARQPKCWNLNAYSCYCCCIYQQIPRMALEKLNY